MKKYYYKNKNNKNKNNKNKNKKNKKNKKKFYGTLLSKLIEKWKAIDQI